MDIDAGLVSFAINGKLLGEAQAGTSRLPGLSPAVALRVGFECTLCLGPNSAFKYPQLAKGHKSVAQATA